jgi:hypothetical protein
LKEIKEKHQSDMEYLNKLRLSLSAPSQSENERMEKMLSNCINDISQANSFPVQIGNDVFDCPIVCIKRNKKYSWNWAIVGEDNAFPVKRKKGTDGNYLCVFVLDEMFHQRSLRDLIFESIGYSVRERW